MRTSESTTDLWSSLFSAKTKFVKAARDKQNSHLKNRYATLDSMLDAVEPALEEYGLMIMQSMTDDSTPDSIKLETILMHKSGQWAEYLMLMPIVKRDPQGVGSAMTYARRYALAAILGISQADDDAQLAVKSATDWKKDIDKCETIDDLKKVGAAMGQMADEAIKAVAREHYARRDAALKAKQATGFQPAKVEKAEKVTVADEPKNDVQSQPIEDFN